MIKLVINSHSDYSIPRKVMLDSLLDSGFIIHNNVIEIISGCSYCSEPTIDKKESDDYNLIRIYDTYNNYDYNGFNVLHKYKNHPLIISDFYLYLHDTITFDKSFNSRFKSLSKTISKHKKNSIFISEGFHSNICILGYDVIDNIKDNFKQFALSKKEAVDLEIKQRVIKDKKIMLGIKSFGKITYLPERIDTGLIKDIYGTGFSRTCFYYEKLGLYKWILWGHFGDITYGEIKKIC